MENLGYKGKVQVGHSPGSIHIGFVSVAEDIASLSSKSARELFEAGLRMCDELEGKA